MSNEPPPTGIPAPYELAQYFNKVFSDRSQLNGKMKVDAACGLMMYYLASEVARIGDLLGVQSEDLHSSEDVSDQPSEGTDPDRGERETPDNPRLDTEGGSPRGTS